MKDEAASSSTDKRQEPTPSKTQRDVKKSCLPSFPYHHCVKSANSVPGGKNSLVIGSRKNVSEAEINVLLFSRPLCRANAIQLFKALWIKALYTVNAVHLPFTINSPEEWAGLPSLGICLSGSA